MGEPNHSNLIKLAADYNHKFGNDVTGNVFRKNAPFLKCNFELVAGTINYKNNEDVIASNSFNGGVLAHLWMPRTNENLYFRTGILYSQANTIEGKKDVFKFPVQVEYVYPKGILRPRLAVGLNLYTSMLQTYALMGGINIVVDKNVVLGLSYDVDFNKSEKVFILPKVINTQSLTAGIYFSF